MAFATDLWRLLLVSSSGCWILSLTSFCEEYEGREIRTETNDRVVEAGSQLVSNLSMGTSKMCVFSPFRNVCVWHREWWGVVRIPLQQGHCFIFMLSVFLSTPCCDYLEDVTSYSDMPRRKGQGISPAKSKLNLHLHLIFTSDLVQEGLTSSFVHGKGKHFIT